MLHQGIEQIRRARRQHKSLWIPETKISVPRFLDLDEILELWPFNAATSEILMHIPIRASMHMEREFLRRHFEAA